MTEEARCLCGAITFTVSGDPESRALCSCTHCQKTSGSAFTIGLAYHQDKVNITSSAKPKVYNDTGDSGRTFKRYFCQDCGSPVFSMTNDGTYFVKGPTFRVGLSKVDHIDMSIFTKNRPTWLRGIHGGTDFEGAPPD